MTRTRPSSHAQRHGFTLLELMVVMALLAIAASLTGPRLWAMLQPSPERDLPRQLVEQIDRLRSDAVFRRKTQAAEIDIEANVLHTPRGDWRPPEGWLFVALPEVAATADPAAAPAAPPTILSLEFLADGSASSLRFALQGPSRPGWQFHISPHTGRLSIQPLASETPDV
ncbi:prepilin-type N-terminal cleavage/methylation domain-containing protein [Chitinimonas prasina]|nr:prepilin-type N-terminal cleavage/methylation domain-containing protein [Chitinimonas prasina]